MHDRTDSAGTPRVWTADPRHGRSRVICAFVGLLDDEGRVAENAAYSPAGTHFQEALLEGLKATTIRVTEIFALRPVASYPASRRLVYGSRRTVIRGTPTTLLPFLNLGPFKTITSGLTLLPRLLSWAWRERGRPRLLLLYNLYSPPGIVSVVAGWLTRTRVVAVVADIQVPGQGLLPDTALRRLDYRLQVVTLPLFDGLVVLTRSVANEFAHATPHIEMEGAVPDALMAPLPDPGPRKDDAPFVVMYAGGLSELKGVPLLLAAFSRLPGERYSLWITGRGPLEAAVRAAAARDPRIRYLGFPSTTELLTLYASADVLVNPHSSTHASARFLFPSKLIEYLATGTPVISTCSTPGVAESYGDVATVMASDDPEELSRHLVNFAQMTHRERRALGARARDFVIREKTWSSQASRIGDFAAGVVEGR